MSEYMSLSWCSYPSYSIMESCVPWHSELILYQPHAPAFPHSLYILIPVQYRGEDHATKQQETPSHFKFCHHSDETSICSVYNSGAGAMILIKDETGAIELQQGKHTTTFLCPIEQPSISVCTDDDYGYEISGDNHIRKFDLPNGRTIHKWSIPMNAPIHHQMTVINGKIYYCNVNNNEIIVFPTSAKSVNSIMSLGTLEKPAYIADNTKHKEETVIISGALGVGRFPIRHGFSDPEWLTRIEHPRGVCADQNGLIYVAKCQPSAILMLSQQTGKNS